MCRFPANLAEFVFVTYTVCPYSTVIIMKITPILGTDSPLSMPLPLQLMRVECGFPNPADDFLDQALDLNEHPLSPTALPMAIPR